MKRVRESPARSTTEPAQGSHASLSDADVDRFSRQIIIPGLGATGQARLMASTVFILGDDPASTLARSYARAAGLRITDDPATASCCVVRIEDPLGAEQRSRLEGAYAPIVWYRLEDTELRAGVVDRVEDLVASPRSSAPAAAAQEQIGDARRHAMLAAAACDAISTVIGLLLQWPHARDDHEVTL